MNFFKFDQIGKMDPNKLRRKRLQDILNKPAKNDDDVRFLIDYLEKGSRETKQFFCDYSQEMYLQLLESTKYGNYSKDGFIYNKGDPNNKFYLVLEGHIEILSESIKQPQDSSTPSEPQKELKVSKTADTGKYFGKLESTAAIRNDYAKCTKPTEILIFDKEAYDSILKQKVLDTSEKKLEFLLRFVPKLRTVARSITEELEIFFIKEQCSKGYPIVKQGEFDDYVYFVFAGTCRMLYDSKSNDKIRETLRKAKLVSKEIKQDARNIVLGELKTGDCFGENGSLGRARSLITVEASSNVEYYKINRHDLLQNFGGNDSEVVLSMRGNMIVKNNWINMKISQLQNDTIERFSRLHYRDEEEFIKLNPRKVVPQEVPFLKRKEFAEKKVNPGAATRPIADFSIPATKPAPQKVETTASALKAMDTKEDSKIEDRKSAIEKLFNRPQKEPEEKNKYGAVMGFGTPRIVPRSIHGRQMDASGAKALLNLRNEGLARRGLGEKQEADKAVGGFQLKSIQNFQKNVMQAEALPEKKPVGPSANFMQKLNRMGNEDAVKNKLAFAMEKEKEEEKDK